MMFVGYPGGFIYQVVSLRSRVESDAELDHTCKRNSGKRTCARLKGTWGQTKKVGDNKK